MVSWMRYCRWLKSRSQSLDPHRVHLKPLRPAGNGTKTQGTAGCRNCVLVVKPGNETKGTGWWLEYAQHGLTIDPEESLILLPFQHIGVPCSHIDV